MNISGTSNSLSSLAAMQGLQPQQLSGTTDANDGSTTRPHRMHGGGHMRQAVTQALQSLGLTLPSASSSTGPTGSTSTDGSSASSDSDTVAGSIQQDMQQFMHSLFEAVKSEGPTSAAAASSTGDSRASFSNGLSSLISQVSSGSAPADLQSAFSKLAADLQGSAATASPAAASPGSAASSVQATLQAFLTSLQQDLGYGSSNASAAGSLVTTQV